MLASSQLTYSSLQLQPDLSVCPDLPNPTRHPQARWDAYVHVPDTATLAAELRDRDVTFSAPLADTDDSLRGFELTDHDGYVLFFGRPADDAD
jgi:hypothetical protein